MSTQREGFTFIELMIVMVMGAILLTGAYTTMVRQEQTYRVFSARTAAQQDTRTGIELLTSEFREVSTSGTDLLMATPDSIRFRALRKFGIVCNIDNLNTRITVAQIGADPFAAKDSIIVYVDQDSLRATDDIWRREQVGQVGTPLNCGTTTLGLSVAVLMPESTLRQLSLTGTGVPLNLVYPGAPVRSFETLTYRAGSYDGQRMLVRVGGNGTISPLYGPIPSSGGLALSYYDTLGTELTSFPLSAADRGAVERIHLELRSRRQTGASTQQVHTDSLITDIYLRGS